MNTYRITDSVRPGVSTLIGAESREAAQEIYIDRCEAKGFAHGDLRVMRVD